MIFNALQKFGSAAIFIILLFIGESFAQVKAADFNLLSQIRINQAKLTVELADTQEKRKRGLMGRSYLLEDAGMLFIFEQPQILCFWMKNTKIPLSIGFFDENRCLINIENMDPQKSEDLRLYKSQKPARYALEVPQGWFERHQISPSMQFDHIIEP